MGSRLFRAHGPLMNIHSLAGAIGMGLPMAVGTAIANPQRKVVGLVGDGGLSLNLGELATLAQEKANVTLLIMNDGGYGVMRGIQDKYFGGRQYYNELHTPDFTLLAQAIGLQAWSVESAEDFQAVMTEALAIPGPSVVEVKMGQIGALPARRRRRCINITLVTPTLSLPGRGYGTAQGGVNQGAGVVAPARRRGPAQERVHYTVKTR